MCTVGLCIGPYGGPRGDSCPILLKESDVEGLNLQGCLAHKKQTTPEFLDQELEPFFGAFCKVTPVILHAFLGPYSRPLHRALWWS